MCGIAGIVNQGNLPDSEKLIHLMTDAIAHRGPDDDGFLCDEKVALGHRRLSIIDLENGHQPMSNEDGNVSIVFNGEIYNHTCFREELISKGHTLKTNCDTEILLHLYEEYGPNFLNRINGMFALCIYDKRHNRIFLARDRMGQKPLFYFCDHSRKRLIFCSELGGLKQHPDLPREFNLQSIHDFLSLQYIPCPFTIYKGVYKLPPANYLEFNIDTGQFKTERYWQLDFARKSDLEFEDACDHLRELLTTSVKRRLMSDVPYGAFLSGGMDSSIIAGIMSKLCDHPVKTFTIGFEEKRYDERRFAHQVAASLEGKGLFPIEYHEKVVNPQDFDILKKLVRHYGEPYSDASMLPTYLLSEFTRENVTVALSGDGADELFAGYERYLIMRYTAYSDLLPPFMRQILLGLPAQLIPDSGERTFTGRLKRALKTAAAHSDRRYVDIINRFNEKLKKQVYGDKFSDFIPQSTYETISSVYDTSNALNRTEKVMDTDIQTYLPGDILTKVDIASMACSLEIRSPFMDHEVAEFAASLPLEYKMCGVSRKHILKTAFEDLIPMDILNRRKKGFGVPLADWFRGPWQKKLHEHLLEGKLVSEGFFKEAPLKSLLQQHSLGRTDASYPLWSLLVLELFLEQEEQDLA
ncbi:MAG: asparagine synthase (glutamine-hydrolyzing) [Lentisphaerae bacterium]|nr:asparagine synthase (glutamine-hydrolyzing) [Lentisphaerota bacterium]MCP4101128.1 asparagine synthase (glutamine-hydrolyzing) [Lentisphaerota bacterium]